MQSAVIKERTIWENITLVVTLDLLYNNFEMTIAPLLYSSNKNLEQIQQIVTSTKLVNLTEQIVGVTTDLALMSKKKQSVRAANLKSEEESSKCGK